MINWKEVPIPQLMLDHCERDPRGLPVPFVVLKDKDGKHHFKINDSEKSAICLVRGLCSICGQAMLSSNKWLVGGIASAFDPGGYYIDLPVHKECGQYALQVCPYLAVRNYNGKIDMMKLQQQLPTTQLHNPTVDQDRLPLFVFTRPSAISFYLRKPDGVLVKPNLPYLEVEFWDEGLQITDLSVVLNKIQNTKWEKYGAEIRKLPGYSVQIA